MEAQSAFILPTIQSVTLVSGLLLPIYVLKYKRLRFTVSSSKFAETEMKLGKINEHKMNIKSTNPLKPKRGRESERIVEE
jgi:hypothetical protein